MAVTKLEIRRQVAFAGGVEFGEAGAYERLDGVIHFAVDPKSAANAQIVDLGRARCGPDGLVHFNSDFCLLRPADPANGRRTLLFDVLNRGGRTTIRLFNRGVQPLTPTDEIDPHDGWLFRNGWTVAACGWQWDVPRGEVTGIMGIDAPLALAGGAPIEGQVCVELQPNATIGHTPLCDRLGLVPFRPYPAASLDQPDAIMTVQDGPHDPREVVSRERWGFGRIEDGKVVPDATHAWLEGGFEAGRIYDIIYRTNHSPVVGAGLLAVRDTTAFLRHGGEVTGNPCAGRIDTALGFGISQSGRFLRTFLHHGLNTCEDGRQVFDGLLPHVAGGRRGEFNHRFAQPSQEVTPGFGHLPPFAEVADGGQPGLFERQTANRPLVITTNTMSEYWRGDASLVHIDATGTRDLEVPPSSRVYMFAGAPHAPGFLPMMDTSPLGDGARGLHKFNVVDYRPLLRAALVNLESWVKDGVQPPPSAVPHIADGSAISRSEALGTMPCIPGMTVPIVAKLRSVPHLDMGPGEAEGVGAWPPEREGVFPCLVSALDEDGNELAGVRLPDLTVPVATHVGWNPRHPETGGEGQSMRFVGATLPFSADARARALTGDPRASIAERYRDRDEYKRRIHAAAGELAEKRFLLEADIPVVVEACLKRYDAMLAAQETGK